MKWMFALFGLLMPLGCSETATDDPAGSGGAASGSGASSSATTSAGGSSTGGTGGSGAGGAGASGGAGGGACNLDDHTPDDCYDVPFTAADAQHAIDIRDSSQVWNCSTEGGNVFLSECFQHGTNGFPGGTWRNAVFDEGKIVSIEIAAIVLRSSVMVSYDSPGWVGVGKGGNYDLSISRLPGDFSDNLPAGCVQLDAGSPKLTVQNVEHPVGDIGCWLEPDQIYYLNVRLRPGTCMLSGEPAVECSHTFVGYGDPGW